MPAKGTLKTQRMQSKHKTQGYTKERQSPKRRSDAGHHILAFQAGFTAKAPHLIPCEMSLCTWVPRNGLWVLKFVNRLCKIHGRYADQ